MRLHSASDPGPNGTPATPQRVSATLAEIYADLARTRAQRAGLDGGQQEVAAQRAIAEWHERRGAYLQRSVRRGWR